MHIQEHLILHDHKLEQEISHRRRADEFDHFDGGATFDEGVLCTDGFVFVQHLDHFHDVARQHVVGLAVEIPQQFQEEDGRARVVRDWREEVIDVLGHLARKDLGAHERVLVAALSVLLWAHHSDIRHHIPVVLELQAEHN